MTSLYMKEDLRKQIDQESDTTVVYTSPPSKMMYVECYTECITCKNARTVVHTFFLTKKCASASARHSKLNKYKIYTPSQYTFE